jgi:undecaprenyl-diphosphatase
MITQPGPPGHHHIHLFQDHRWAIAGAALMYAAAVSLFITMGFDGGRSFLQPVDDAWHDLMAAWEDDVVITVAKGFDILGGVFVTAPLRVVMGLYLAVKRRWWLVATWIGAVMISELPIGLFKAIYDRPRPFDGVVDSTGSSFPSGHATAGAATAIALVIVLLAPGEHRRAWEVRAGLFAFFMALSRTYLRVHWLTDVVAGALFGAATALAVATVIHLIRVRLDLESHAGVPTGR